jgi:hypothetical protein
MELKLKKYKFERVEIDNISVKIPKNTEYYFETGIRRSIRVSPILSSWKEPDNREEILYLEFLLIYNSWETKIELKRIQIRDIEEVYYNESDPNHNLIKAYFEGWFSKRSKEQFLTDYKLVIDKMGGCD